MLHRGCDISTDIKEARRNSGEVEEMFSRYGGIVS